MVAPLEAFGAHYGLELRDLSVVTPNLIYLLIFIIERLLLPHSNSFHFPLCPKAFESVVERLTPAVHTTLIRSLLSYLL